MLSKNQSFYIKIYLLDTDKYSAMSENLRTRIRKSVDTNYVWIDCQGRYPADRQGYDPFYCLNHDSCPALT